MTLSRATRACVWPATLTWPALRFFKAAPSLQPAPASEGSCSKVLDGGRSAHDRSPHAYSFAPTTPYSLPLVFQWAVTYG
jgi:hypothetical protein